jgi:hypothetical protein
VTSERWLPLLEVGPRDLGSYLQEMRRRGYALVGVEQAAGSVPLQAFAFPTRCVLLLGNEQSGVPQELIAQLVRGRGGGGVRKCGRGRGEAAEGLYAVGVEVWIQLHAMLSCG